MYLHDMVSPLDSNPRLVAQTCMAIHSRMAARAVSRAYDEVLRPLDLKITQFAVLVAAHGSNGKHTISELAEMMGLERTSLSRNLEPLERRGLVDIGPETRHRARHIGLTDAGLALLEQALPLWDSAQQKLKDNLGDDAWSSTLATLKQLSERA